MRGIGDICAGKTRDNYSCWLIPITKGVRSGQLQEHPGHIMAEISKQGNQKTLSGKALALIIGLCSAAIAAAAICLAF